MVIVSRRRVSLAVAAMFAFGLVFASRAGAQGPELRNPRLQRSLQMLEVARAQLDAAAGQYPPDMRDAAQRAARDVDAAAHAITDELAAQGTRRTIEPGRAVPTDRPARAARDALRQALDELTRGVNEQDMKGRVRAAFERQRAALDQADALASREAALPPPPPPAPAMRHPGLQRAIQQLELARAQLDAAQRRLPRDLRDEVDRAARDVDAAGQEAAAALAASGTTRTIGPAAVVATDRPLRAAQDALHRANDELAALAGGDGFRGHLQVATDRARSALDQVDRLARREDGRR